MGAIRSRPLPWPLTFSYGRAVQDDVLASWAKDGDQEAARAILIERAHANGDASLGKLPAAA